MDLGKEKALVAGFGFPEASAGLLERRSLQRRVDTKFILDGSVLRRVLGAVAGRYALLWSANEPVATYRTLYFDTVDHQAIREHHRGRRPRHKVRVRHYLDRQLSFLEVKRKTSADTTVKARQAIAYSNERLSSTDKEFINAHNPIDAGLLVSGLRTHFGRITLVGLKTEERATFDVQLSFAGPSGEASLPGVVVAEIKQARFMARSPVMLALRECGVRPAAMSKYCTAAMLLCPEISLNRFQPILRTLRQACHD